MKYKKKIDRILVFSVTDNDTVERNVMGTVIFKCYWSAT